MLQALFPAHDGVPQKALLLGGKCWDGGKVGLHLVLRDAAVSVGVCAAFCDSAEPKSIVDLRANGIDARATYKRPDAVRYRINWLQHRKIIIDPARTPNAYREFTEYEYMTDKDGNITGELPDANNHTIDAVAYSLTPVIWNYAGEAGIDNRPTPARPLE